MERLACVPLLWGLLIAPRVEAAPRASIADALADDRLAAAIASDLARHEGVRAREVRAEVSDGIVHLTGTVADLLAAERAVAIARGIPGVRAVVDRIVVDGPSRTDAAIRGAIVDAWAMDPAIETFQISGDVAAGIVTLTGTVDSAPERDLAELLAKGVPGVRSVDNQLRVSPPTHRTDAELLADVRARLRWSVLVDARAVRVDVSDGVVTLAGQVPTREAHAHVLQLASVDGVARVVDALAVPDAAEAPPRVAAADEEIQRALQDALRLDPRVRADDVTIEVVGGAVRLIGAVPHVDALLAADDDAWNTVGVSRVENRLEVHRPAPLGSAD